MWLKIETDRTENTENESNSEPSKTNRTKPKPRCIVSALVLSTDHIYHRAAKRPGDKFDRSMTRDKLLDNNPTLFIFYFYSNDDPIDSKTNKRTDSRNADSRNGDSRNKQVTTATAVSHAFPWCVRLSSYIPGFASVDLIGENNQVRLEYILLAHCMYTSIL